MVHHDRIADPRVGTVNNVERLARQLHLVLFKRRVNRLQLVQMELGSTLSLEGTVTRKATGLSEESGTCVRSKRRLNKRRKRGFWQPNLGHSLDFSLVFFCQVDPFGLVVFLVLVMALPAFSQCL